MSLNSTLTIRSVDGLRVALAGLPETMPVRCHDDFDLGVATVGELRRIAQVPGPLAISIPYRLLDDSVVSVGRPE